LYKSIFNQIDQIKLNNKRTHAAIQVNEEAKVMYSILDEQVKQQVEKARDQVNDSQNILRKAHERRRSAVKCHALTKIIKTKPDRMELEGKRHILEKNLESRKVILY